MKTVIPGEKHGKWTIIRELPVHIYTCGARARWLLCECECGTIKETNLYHVCGGRSTSCGCVRNEKTISRNFVHGLYSEYLYDIWQAIIQRCCNKNQRNYDDYGGRGITIYESWKASFEAFYYYIMHVLGERPEGWTLDRKNNNKGYEPDNLRWATYETQANNRRGGRVLTSNTPEMQKYLEEAYSFLFE